MNRVSRAHDLDGRRRAPGCHDDRGRGNEGGDQARTFVVEAPGRRRGKKRRRRYHQAHHGRRTTPNLVQCHGALGGDGAMSRILGTLTAGGDGRRTTPNGGMPAGTDSLSLSSLGGGKALETR